MALDVVEKVETRLLAPPANGGSALTIFLFRLVNLRLLAMLRTAMYSRLGAQHIRIYVLRQPQGYSWLPSVGTFFVTNVCSFVHPPSDQPAELAVDPVIYAQTSHLRVLCARSSRASKPITTLRACSRAARHEKTKYVLLLVSEGHATRRLLLPEKIARETGAAFFPALLQVLFFCRCHRSTDRAFSLLLLLQPALA